MATNKDFIVKNGIQVLGVGSVASTSTSTGALVVKGGLGVSGAANIGGQTFVLDNTSATNQSSGALQVTGGVGVGGDLYAANIYSNGAEVITTATLDVFSGVVQSITAGTDISVSTSTGDVTINDISTLQSVTSRGSSTSVVVTFSNNTNATNTSSGAVIVKGGVAVGRDIWIGGTARAGYVNPANLTNGNVTYYNGTSLVDNDNLKFNGTVLTVGSTTAASNTSSGALQVAGGVGVGGSLYATAVYSDGSQVLTSITPTAGTAITVTSVTTSNGNTSFTINNNGVTSLAGTTYLGVSASTGAVTLTNLGVQSLSAGTETTVSASTGANISINVTSTLQNVTSRGATTDQAISITNTSSASSAAVGGALTVSGGAGIGQNLYVGTDAYIGGNLYVVGQQFVVDSTNISAGESVLTLSTGSTSTFAATGAGLQIGPVGSPFVTLLFDGVDAWKSAGNFNPSANNTWNLGSTSTQWNSLYVNQAYINGAEVVTTATIGSAGVTSLTAGDAYLYVDHSSGAVTIYNYGVTDLSAGTGITLDASTGSVTITNDGVIELTAGTDISITGSKNNYTINSTYSYTPADTLDDVVGRGAITASAIKVGGLIDSALTTNGGVVYTDSTGTLLNSSGLTYDGSGGLTVGTSLSVSGSGGDLTLSGGNIGGVVGIAASTATFSNTSFSTSTIAGNAVQINGGLGVEHLYVHQDLYVNGQLVVSEQTLSTLTVAAIYAGPGISVNEHTGTVTISNTGVIAIVSGTDISISYTGAYPGAGTVTIDDNSTLETVTGRGAATTNAIQVTNNTAATSVSTGAVVVSGGIGIGGNAWIGGTANVGPATQLLSFVSATTSTAAQLSLDSFTVATYTSAKYLVQIVDTGYTPQRVQVEELLVFHDDNGGSTNAYIVKYGLGYNVQELGDFDAVYTGGNVVLKFTPNYNPTSLTVKTSRVAITT